MVSQLNPFLCAVPRKYLPGVVEQEKLGIFLNLAQLGKPTKKIDWGTSWHIICSQYFFLLFIFCWSYYDDKTFSQISWYLYQIEAYVRSNVCCLIYLRHLIKSGAVINWMFSHNRHIFFHACSTCSELQPNYLFNSLKFIKIWFLIY